MNEIAIKISGEILNNNKPKKLKVRTLIKKFGFVKRTDESSRMITQLLSELEIYINPSIMKIGDAWKLTLDDRVTLYHDKKESLESVNIELNPNYNDDGWFDNLGIRIYRSEREVETKFIIPLLSKLGYSEDDRFDGMTFKAYNGSRPTILETDFSLFDANSEILDNQVLLVVEAKREDRLIKEVELLKAQKQTKSYAIWLSCHFGLISDGKKVQVLDLFPSIGGINVLFECDIVELKAKFKELNSLVGKNRLISYYEELIN